MVSCSDVEGEGCCESNSTKSSSTTNSPSSNLADFRFFDLLELCEFKEEADFEACPFELFAVVFDFDLALAFAFFLLLLTGACLCLFEECEEVVGRE